MRSLFLGLTAVLTLTTSIAHADVIPLNLLGNAGFGLLPGNNIGNNTATPGSSSAIGGEIGQGFVLNTDTGLLEFGFEFSGLTGGLFDAAGGIHIHEADPSDPFNTTGPILFNLNAGTDSNVSLSTSNIAIGATSGSLAGTITLTEQQEQGFIDGIYYLNIHSDSFRAGELRGNVTAIPEPTSGLALVAMGIIGGVAARRRLKRRN